MVYLRVNVDLAKEVGLTTAAVFSVVGAMISARAEAKCPWVLIRLGEVEKQSSYLVSQGMAFKALKKLVDEEYLVKKHKGQDVYYALTSSGKLAL